MDHSHHTHIKKPGHSIKDFYPLFVVLTVVAVLAIISVAIFSLPIMTSFMAWFFIIFGGLKISKLKHFAIAYKEYDVVAKRSNAYAHAYPFVELAFGIAYLTQFYLSITNIIVIVVMLISAYGVYLKLKEKEEIPCACLGTVFKVPMTWVTLGEDLVMAGMALAMLLT
jgi:hypothetical protein